MRTDILPPSPANIVTVTMWLLNGYITVINRLIIFKNALHFRSQTGAKVGSRSVQTDRNLILIAPHVSNSNT